MNYLRNVRVAWRLGLGFGLLLLLVAAVVATGATASVVQKRAMQQVVDVSVAKVRLLSQMLDANNQMMVVRREMLIRQGDDRSSDEKRIADLVKRYEASWSAYQALPGDAEGKAIAETIATKRAIARPLNKQTSELMEQGDYPGAVALTLGPVQDAANGWNKALSDGVDFEEKESRKAAAEAIRLGERSLLQLLVLGGVALLAGIAASVMIGRSLTGPLARAVNLAERLSKGQLDQEFRLGGRDELTSWARPWPASARACRRRSARSCRWPNSTKPAQSVIAWMPVPSPAISAAWCRPPTAWSNRTCRWNC